MYPYDYQLVALNRIAWATLQLLKLDNSQRQHIKADYGLDLDEICKKLTEGIDAVASMSLTGEL